jgi:6-phosphogluconolactonase
MPYVYVSNADSGDITVLHLAAGGELRLQSRLDLGGRLMPMARHPSRPLLVVARRSAPMAALSLAVDPATGEVHLLAEAPLPASMAYLSMDASGRWLLAASYPDHLLTVSPLQEDGRVGAVAQTLPTGPHAHAIVVAPSHRHVLATSLGGGLLMVFDWDADTGRISPAQHWHARPGAGPRHFRFDRHGRFVYLLNELDASLDVLSWNPAQGRLSHLQTVSSVPPGFTGQPWAADLHLTPDGRQLYSSERSSSTLAHFAVDPVTGLLSAQGHTKVEAQPRGFAIDPAGRQLLVVGELSHPLSRLCIDPDSGQLKFEQRIQVGQGPNWVEILP